ncbi:MAG: hypothetical protein ACTSVC_06045 [Promethearchaeota archaeon]
MSEDVFDNMEQEINSIVNSVVSDDLTIKGIVVSTHGGKKIYSYKTEESSFNENQLAAATTSLLFISSNLFEKLLNQEVKYTITKGQNLIFLCILTKDITGTVILDRELAELSGISDYKKKMVGLFLKISVIVETSDIVKEDLFVIVKKAIPNAISIAIINKEGLPIKVQSALEGPQISAFIYALYQLSNVILNQKAEYTIVSGEYGSIIIQKIDSERILGIAVPESDESNLGKYIAKIQEIAREHNQ